MPSTPESPDVNVNYLATVVERLTYEVHMAEGEQSRKARRFNQTWLGALLLSLISALTALVASALLREPLPGVNPLDGAIRLIAIMLVVLGVVGMATAWLTLGLARGRPIGDFEGHSALVRRLTEDILSAAERGAAERQR